MDALSILAGAVLMAGNVIYLREVWLDRTKPTAGSWLTWFVLDVVLLCSMYKQHVVNGQVVASLVSSAIIGPLSCFPRWGSWEWTKTEKICLGLTPYGLLWWWATENAVVAMSIFLALIACTCLPTYESAWKNPERENKWAWTIWLVSSVVMLAGLHDWSFTSAAQPVVWFVTQLPMMYLVWLHKK